MGRTSFQGGWKAVWSKPDSKGRQKVIDWTQNPTGVGAGKDSGMYGTGDIDKDWTSGNANFNSDTMMRQAKEMSQTQLDNSLKMMGESAKFRNQEYSHRAGEDRTSTSHNAGEERTSYTAKTTDDMRRDSQQQSFQSALQSMNNTHDMGMQTSRQEQERTMFDKQQAAESQSTWNRAARAANLWNGGKSGFAGKFRFK